MVNVDGEKYKGRILALRHYCEVRKRVRQQFLTTPPLDTQRGGAAPKLVLVSDPVIPVARRACRSATVDLSAEAFDMFKSLADTVAKAELLISHCPARPGQVATQNFGNGFRPNWVGSRPSLRRSRSDAPTFLSTATKTKIFAKKTRIPTIAVQRGGLDAGEQDVNAEVGFPKSR
jgi:hypothetical protein